MTGMKADGDLLNTEDVDIGGEQVVQSLQDPSRRHCLCRTQVGNLAEGMYSGIGAAGSLNFNRFSEQLLRRID